MPKNSRIEIEFELKEMKVRIRADRVEDIPLAREAIGLQMSNLLGPAAAIAEGEMPAPSSPIVDSAPAAAAPAKRKPSSPRRKPAGVAGYVDDDAGAVIAFTHDIAKWSNPQLKWKGSEKAFWLMYVIQAQTDQTEFAATQIRSTFNSQFKEAGVFKRTSNIIRDLPKLMWDGQRVVGDHEGKYYLTQVKDAFYKQLTSESVE